MVKLPTVSLKVDRPNVPPATVTAAPFAKRSAAPRFIVPLFTLTVVDPSDPLSVVVPLVTVAVPAAKFALTVPPCKAYVAAVNVEPLAEERTPPEIVNDATVSSPPREYVPALTLTVEVLATMLAAEVSNVPPDTVIPDEDKATPEEILPPLTVVVPA